MITGAHGVEIAKDHHVLILFEEGRNCGVDPVNRGVASSQRRDRGARFEVKADQVEVCTRLVC